MEKITLLFALVFYGISIGQSNDLVNYSWRCTSIEIDGVQLVAPNNNEVEKVILNMIADDDPGTEDFVTIVCNALTSSDGQVVYDDTQITFILPELIQTLITCDQSENQDFESEYFAFFYDSQGSPLSYEIIELTEYVMTITAPNGDMAHYQETSLGLSDRTINTIAIYPNPASTQVTIVDTSKDTIDRIEFYAITGQVMKTIDHPATLIDLSALSQGNYFLKIYSGDSFTIKQFVKR